MRRKWLDRGESIEPVECLVRRQHRIAVLRRSEGGRVGTARPYPPPLERRPRILLMSPAATRTMGLTAARITRQMRPHGP
jgi:hypothetical protein